MPDASSSPVPAWRRVLPWLVAGVLVAGLLAAALQRNSRDEMPLVARVNGVPIPVSTFATLVEGLESERPAGDTGSVHELVLERLIDEELLFQRAEEIGMLRTDHGIRKRAVALLVDAVVREAEAEEASEEQLRSFFGQHRARFESPARVRVAQAFVRVPASAGPRARAEARARAERLAGELAGALARGAVPQPLGDALAIPLPDVLLGQRELAELVGPSAAQAAFALGELEVAEPLEVPGGFRVIAVLERGQPDPPVFEEVRGQVVTLHRRMVGERALVRYVAALRAQARIELHGP